MVAFNGLMPDLPAAMPPRGTTFTEVTVNRRQIKQWTYVCPDNDNCHAFACSDISEEWAVKYLDGHACPADNRRSLVPSGKGWTEKMWDTMDDALDAYIAKTPYLEYGGDKLSGFMLGVAECIAIVSIPKYQVQEVLDEVKRRWRMRTGQTAFSPTPGYRFTPLYGATRSQALPEFAGYSDGDFKPSTPKRTPLKKIAAAPVVVAKPMRALTETDKQLIIDAVAAGTTRTQVAALFDIPESIIEGILNPPKMFMPPMGM